MGWKMWSKHWASRWALRLIARFFDRECGIWGWEFGNLKQSEDLGFGSLGSGGWPALPSQQQENPVPLCTGCKGGELATGFCRECANYLCSNCAQGIFAHFYGKYNEYFCHLPAHRYMNIFEGHNMEELAGNGEIPSLGVKPRAQSGGGICMCLEHRQQPLVLFCQFCQQAICRECMQDHQGCEVEQIDNVADKQIGMMEVRLFLREFERN